MRATLRLDTRRELGVTGNAVVVIGHNLKSSGLRAESSIRPGGGDGGGEIMAAGTPEEVVKEKRTYRGTYLKPVVAKGGPKRKRAEAAE